MIKAVLFDIGSTLIEGPTISPAKKISQMLAGDFSLKQDISALIMTTRINTPAELASILEKKWGSDKVDITVLEEIWNEQLNSARVKDGAVEIYQHCRKLGLTTCFISNIWRPYYLSFAKVCPEVEGDADHRFLSYEMGVQKPDVEIFKKVLNELQLKPEEVAIIGDTYDCDIEPAIALGIKTIWFLHRPDNERESIVRIENKEAKKADFTVESLDEIASSGILEELLR